MIIRLRNRLIRQSRAMRRNEDGSAAIEFALVALPFFALVIALVEVGIFFFASRFLEDAVFSASRRALTGQTTGCADFKTAIRNNVSGWLDPDKLVISVQQLTTFGGTRTALNLEDAGCSIVPQTPYIVSVEYAYPFVGYRFNPTDAVIGADLKLFAATAFVTER